MATEKLKYYIEAVHNENGGGDHVAVAWKGPGVSAGVISGRYLSPYPSGAKGTINREVWKNRAKAAAAAKSDFKPERPIKVAPGVIHVEAEDFFTKSNVGLENCYTGGKQVNPQKNMNSTWIDYSINVPASGVYGLTMRVAAPNYKQVLNISSGKDNLATIKIPNTTGLWKTTKEVPLKLKKGTQTLRLSAPFQRGIAVRWFELKSK